MDATDTLQKSKTCGTDLASVHNGDAALVSLDSDEVTCAKCGGSLVDIGGQCADGDEECDCDKLAECDRCGQRFVKNCPAHVGTEWS